MPESKRQNKNKSIKTTKDTPPTIHEDPVPLEDLKIEEKEMKKKEKSKNSSSTERKETK
ncbi:hypothetical protein [Alteribacillus bidgolensis]|uniref:Uncharacterized protein n=1 Tax=Alteribacillus bidgolensis TaxID=930129 RepID=A0A1G8NXK1_9BACI|nr:hypothetical protein [Alteribacillus bidgolensis]SDI84250.1 hypothetical protein SAMN05216352_1137 [Alteribacillus bidgolensis]